jgi:SAM-dependent methyltransferase
MDFFMNSIYAVQQAITTFDKQFLEHGMRAQRSYPNESLIQFVAENYFSISQEGRYQIKILELGCGSGANLWMLAKEGFDTYGLDSSEEALRLATIHLSDKWGVSAKLAHGSFLNLPYPDEFLDCVVDIVSLQHLDLNASSTTLQEIRRVLKRGGKFFSYRLSDHSVMYASESSFVDAVTLSNISNPEMPLANNGPVSFWSPGLVKRLYSESGLTVETIERVARTYPSGKLVEYLAISAFRSE